MAQINRMAGSVQEPAHLISWASTSSAAVVAGPTWHQNSEETAVA